jgi:hypothetical protein
MLKTSRKEDSSRVSSLGDSLGSRMARISCLFSLLPLGSCASFGKGTVVVGGTFKLPLKGLSHEIDFENVEEN